MKRQRLTGSATYSGGAAGIYVDGTASGLFTADRDPDGQLSTWMAGMADATTT